MFNYSDSGLRKELSPTYNRTGALESVVFDGTTYVDHIAYNAKGQRLMIALGNGIMTRYAYDNKTFRLARIRSEKYDKTNWDYSPDGNLKQDTAYFYDLAGNIISTNDQSPNSGVGGSASLERDFSYDPLYRLLSATGRENAPTITPIWDDRYRSDDHTLTTAYTQKYNYDKMGNILRLKHTGSSDFTRIFNPDNGNMPADYGSKNLLNEVKIGSTTYSFQYDANGNLIQENADRFYEWDAADQMRCFFIDDGSTITKHAHYLYDAAGNRVKKLVRVDGGNYTSNTYIDGVFERKTDGTDVQITLHIMDDASRIALLRLGDAMGDSTPPVKYILEDHLGSSVMELKDDGQNIVKEEYYPFGETSFGSHAFKRYKYNGKERDGESGLYYYGARYYSSWCCRFISVDGMAFTYNQLTPYQNAGNNPIGDRDIDGNQSEKTPEGAGKGGGAQPKVESGNGSTGPDLDASADLHSIKGSEAFHNKLNEAMTSGEDYSVNYESFDDDSGFATITIGGETTSYVWDSRQKEISPELKGTTGADLEIQGDTSPEAMFPNYPASGAMESVSLIDIPFIIGEGLVVSGLQSLGMSETASEVSSGVAVILFACFGRDSKKLIKGAGMIKNAAKKGKKALPALDATGKVHGALPKIKDLGRYSKDELQILLQDLRQSVQQRITVTSRMGRDRAHGQRQGAEQDLIKAIEKHLQDI